MDSSRFDDLTKALATSTSRRQALQRIGGTLAGSLLAAWPFTRVRANGNSACATSVMPFLVLIRQRPTNASVTRLMAKACASSVAVWPPPLSVAPETAVAIAPATAVPTVPVPRGSFAVGAPVRGVHQAGCAQGRVASVHQGKATAGAPA